MKTPPNEVMVKRYRAGLGRLAGRMILLLTTTGRKSGRQHTVAVQYEKIDGKVYIGAGYGQKCDWYRNILANPKVAVEIGTQKSQATAEVMQGEERIADFMEYRLKRHPLMIGAILKADGISFRPKREELLAYSKRIAVVILTLEQ
jgi:deazaflavin-dependent oxidoreductase (nitroreductase family)